MSHKDNAKQSADSSKTRIMIQIQAPYFFEEFFIPLIKNFPIHFEIIILVDAAPDPKIRQCLEKWCHALDLKYSLVFLQINSSHKVRNFINIRKICRNFGKLDLFVAADLSTPEVRFLRHELEMIGTPVVFVQASGLHHDFWLSYSNNQDYFGAGKVRKSFLQRLLSFHKYPRYLRYVYRNFFQRLSQLPFRYVLAYVSHRRFYPATRFERFPYIANEGERMFVIYDADCTLLNTVFSPNTATLVNPPYFQIGDKELERDLLFCLPGPLLEKEQQENLGSLIEVVNEIIKKYTVENLLIRLHPRETEQSSEMILDAVRRGISSKNAKNVSNRDLWPVLRRCSVVVGGVSNLLSVARASSRTRKVIGVLNSGLLGVMGSNIQYQDKTGIQWVSSKDDIDWSYFDLISHTQILGKRSDLIEEFQNLINRSGDQCRLIARDVD